MRSIILFRALGILAMVIALLSWSWLRYVRLVETPSVPRGYYFIGFDAELTRDAYVCVDPRSPHAPKELDVSLRASELLLIKRVAALPGDVVDYDGDHVTVNRAPLILSGRLESDGQGHALPKPPYPVVLASNEVWLASEHPRGYDSRYLGAVDARALVCRAELLWRL